MLILDPFHSQLCPLRAVTSERTKESECTQRGWEATRDRMLCSLPDSRPNGECTFVGSSLWPHMHFLKTPGGVKNSPQSQGRLVSASFTHFHPSLLVQTTLPARSNSLPSLPSQLPILGMKESSEDGLGHSNKWDVNSKAVRGKGPYLICDSFKHYTRETF